jgi:hypothetical protein
MSKVIKKKFKFNNEDINKHDKNVNENDAPYSILVWDFINYFEDNVLLCPNLEITTLMTSSQTKSLPTKFSFKPKENIMV